MARSASHVATCCANAREPRTAAASRTKSAKSGQSAEPFEIEYRTTTGSPTRPVRGIRRCTRRFMSGQPLRMPESRTPASMAANTQISRLLGRLAAATATTTTRAR